MLKDFLSTHRTSAMGRRGAWFLVRATCRRSALNMKPLVGTLHPLSWCSCPLASSSAQSGALPKRERQTPGRTSSKRCLHAQSGTANSRGRRSPDRGTLRLGVRDALVGFPASLEDVT